MQVKIDTSEKFHAITIQESSLSANMTADLENSLLPCLKSDVRNVVLNLEDIQNIDDAAGEAIVKIQQMFYEQQASFVICHLQPAVEEVLDKTDLLELMNITPTLSEAMDIVHMEEIERELLGGDE